MSLASNLQTAFTRVASEFKTYRTFLTGSGTGAFSGLNTTAQNIKDAINEVNSKPPATTTLSALTDTGITAPATGQVVRYNAATSKWENVNPLTYFDAAGAATAAQNASQPLDSDLTAIAALTTTAYGRAFLALANQAALLGLFPATSDTVASIQRNATQTEVNAGTLDTAQVTPLKLQTRLAAYAQPLDSDLTSIAALATTSYGRALLTLADQAALTALLPLDTDVALTANSDSKIATQKAVKAYADNLIGANDAMVFKGVINASTNPNYPAASAGWTYKVSVAGKIGGAAGVNVEAGDVLLCTLDGSAAGTQATVGANWDIIQVNVDGAVIGPAASVNGDFAMFSGVGGKLLQDSGLSLDIDTDLTANSDSKIPTQKAVKGYTYSQTQIGDPTTDFAATFVAGLA